MTDKFKKGDRVRINKPDATSHGEVGTIEGPTSWGSGIYVINFDDPLVLCPNWSERYLEPIEPEAAPLEVGDLVEVVNYPMFWNGAKAKVAGVAQYGVDVKLVEQFEEYPIGTAVYFFKTNLVRTSIPVEEPAPVPEQDKVREALKAAKLVFKEDALRYSVKCKDRKEKARWALVELMQDALDDLE